MFFMTNVSISLLYRTASFCPECGSHAFILVWSLLPLLSPHFSILLVISVLTVLSVFRTLYLTTRVFFPVISTSVCVFSLLTSFAPFSSSSSSPLLFHILSSLPHLPHSMTCERRRMRSWWWWAHVKIISTTSSVCLDGLPVPSGNWERFSSKRPIESIIITIMTSHLLLMNTFFGLPLLCLFFAPLPNLLTPYFYSSYCLTPSRFVRRKNVRRKFSPLPWISWIAFCLWFELGRINFNYWEQYVSFLPPSFVKHIPWKWRSWSSIRTSLSVRRNFWWVSSSMCPCVVSFASLSKLTCLLFSPGNISSHSKGARCVLLPISSLFCHLRVSHSCISSPHRILISFLTLLFLTSSLTRWRLAGTRWTEGASPSLLYVWERLRFRQVSTHTRRERETDVVGSREGRARCFAHF